MSAKKEEEIEEETKLQAEAAVLQAWVPRLPAALINDLSGFLARDLLICPAVK